MKYIRNTYDRLSRGGFISSDSLSDDTRRIFKDIEDDFEAYRDYFEQIGFHLETGKGYFYFSRSEAKSTLVDKLKRFGHWIDMLDFIKAWEPIFAPGYTFTSPSLTIKIDDDVELKEKAAALYDTRTRYDDIVEKFIDEMCKAGYIELLHEKSQLYQVVSAYNYLEELIDIITIDSESLSDNEISQ